MIAALHFVPRVALGGVVTIVERAFNREAFGHHALPHHVSGHLMFKAVHALVEITGDPIRRAIAFGFCIIPVRLRERAHQQARFTRHRIPAARFIRGTIRPNVRGKVVAPQRLQGRARLLFRQHAAEADLKSPALTEDLVNLAAAARIDRFRMFRIRHVDEILAVEKPCRHVLAARFRDRATFSGKRIISHFSGHRFDREQTGHIQSAQPRDRPIPLGVQRVVLRAFKNAVGVGILTDEPLHRLLDAGVIAFEKSVVRRHLMIAIGAQNRARLTVHRVAGFELSAMINHPVRFETDGWIKVGAFTQRNVEFGKEPSHRLFILPDVRASSGTTADAFPAVEPSAGKTIRRARGEDGNIQVRAIEKPERQRRVIPGVVPQLRLPFEPREIFRQMAGDRRCGIKAGGIMSAHCAQAIEGQVRKMPRQHKRHRRRFARSERILGGQRTDQLFIRGRRRARGMVSAQLRESILGRQAV